jgi:hypothetical protein
MPRRQAQQSSMRRPKWNGSRAMPSSTSRPSRGFADARNYLYVLRNDKGGFDTG